MKRFHTYALVLLVAVIAVNRSASQELRRVAASSPATDTVTGAEQPMSIFNDKLRRFRFELEETLVTVETAEQFILLHQARNEPPIMGAYADSETNSLVVVGPSDAEQPVRETLAKWMVDRQGVSPPPLNVQKRTLEFRRKELLREMAVLEVQLVAEGGNRAEQLQSRLQSFQEEVTVVEKQIAVVEKYVQRLDVKHITPVSQTSITATEGVSSSHAR